MASFTQIQQKFERVEIGFHMMEKDPCLMGKKVKKTPFFLKQPLEFSLI